MPQEDKQGSSNVDPEIKPRPRDPNFDENGRLAKGNKNSQGRPVGSKNRRSIALMEAMKAKGHMDPIEVLFELASDIGVDDNIRVSAASSAAPFVHSKCAPTPEPVTMAPFEIEPLVSLDAATRSIAKITVALAAGQLDFAAAQMLINSINSFTENFKASEIEQRLLIIESRMQIDG